MQGNKVVSHADWVKARKKLLKKEKEFTRQRDALTRERLKMPWEKIEKDYRFEGPNGMESLADLFDGRSQLIIYHFMFGPDWDVGCKSCSLLADHFDPAISHLAARDVTMIAASRAPLGELDKFKQRMGWSFKWVSSLGSEFNHDFQVSFTEKELANGTAYYNYKEQSFPSEEGPGASVFCLEDDGTVYHTYSVYQRGLDMFISAYHYLDIVPKGRDEDRLDYTMEWVKLHDEYEAQQGP